MILWTSLVQAQDAPQKADQGAAPAVKREAAKKAAAEEDVKKAGETHKAQREERARKDAEQQEALRAKRAAEQDAKADGAADKLDAAALRTKLRAKTTIKAEGKPLHEFLEELSRMHDVPIRVNEPGIKKAGVTKNSRVTVTITNLSLDLTLKNVLMDLGLHYVSEDGALVVTGGRAADEPRQAQVAQRAAVRVARPAIAVMAVDQQAQQFVQQFRPVLLAELHFIRKVCEPTPEQMKNISEQGEKVLQTAATQVADLQRGVRRKIAGQPALSINTEPHRLIRDTLAAAAKLQLSDEQMAKLEAENQRRRQDQVEMSVHSLVARLDQELILSEKQREEITESLRANWQDAWCPSSEMWLMSDMGFPGNIPEKFVSKSLTDAQKQIWKVMQKSQMAPANMMNMMGNFGILQMMQNDDKLWEDEAGETSE